MIRVTLCRDARLVRPLYQRLWYRYSSQCSTTDARAVRPYRSRHEPSIPTRCYTFCAIATWKISNRHVDNLYSPRRRESFPPKFHFILPKFYFTSTWRIFYSHVDIFDFLGRKCAYPYSLAQKSGGLYRDYLAMEPSVVELSVAVSDSYNFT